MAWGTAQGIQNTYAASNANAIPFDVMWMAINYFPQRCPLMYALAKKPLNALTFYMNNDTYRPRTATTNAAYTSAATSLTLVDTTGIDVGDVIEVESERMLVTAVPDSTTLTVKPAFEGTTQANHANTTTVSIITNARTGGDIDQNALSRLPNTVAQYAQTVQHAYQVSGALQSTGAFMGGKVAPLDRDRLMAVQHTMDDFEGAMYKGKGQARTSTVNNPVMKGLKTCLATNNTTSPTNASAYKPSDFTRDTVQKCFDNGGRPNVLLVSTDFLGGLAQWGFTLQRFAPEQTALGVEVETFAVPFLGGIKIIPAPLLGTGTAIALNTDEVGIALKRRLDVYPRGRRGDAEEGDVIIEGAIDVENEAHHAWVSGVTGFAVQS